MPTPDTPPDFSKILGEEPDEADFPDYVAVAPPDHLSLGATLGEGLNQAIPNLLKTAASVIPMAVGGTGLAFALSGVFVAVVLVSVGGYGALLALYNSPSMLWALSVGYVVLIFAMILVFYAVTAVIIAPFLVAMYRSHWRAVDEGVTPGILDGIRGGFRLDLWFAATCMIFLQIVGVSFLILPGILADALTNLTLAGMVIDDLSFPRALGRSLKHFIKAPFWHIGLALVDFVVGAAIGTLIPIVGYSVATSLQVHLNLHAYRDAFPGPPVASRHLDGSEAGPG